MGAASVLLSAATAAADDDDDTDVDFGSVENIFFTITHRSVKSWIPSFRFSID